MSERGVKGLRFGKFGQIVGKKAGLIKKLC